MSVVLWKQGNKDVTDVNKCASVLLLQMLLSGLLQTTRDLSTEDLLLVKVKHFLTKMLFTLY